MLFGAQCVYLAAESQSKHSHRDDTQSDELQKFDHFPRRLFILNGVDLSAGVPRPPGLKTAQCQTLRRLQAGYYIGRMQRGRQEVYIESITQVGLAGLDHIEIYRCLFCGSSTKCFIHLLIRNLLLLILVFERNLNSLNINIFFLRKAFLQYQQSLMLYVHVYHRSTILIKEIKQLDGLTHFTPQTSQKSSPYSLFLTPTLFIHISRDCCIT